MKKNTFKIRLITMFLAVMLIIIGLPPVNVHAASYGKYESNGYYVIAVNGCLAYYGTIRCGCMSCALVNGDNTWWNCNYQGEISVGYFGDVRCNYCRNQRIIAVCRKDSTNPADHAGAENGTCIYCGQEGLVAPTYTVTVTDDGHGTATADITTAAKDDVVTLTATPSAGYVFDKWESEDVTVSEDNKFTMPEKNVTVKAVFKADSSTPAPGPENPESDPTSDVPKPETKNESKPAEPEKTDLEIREALEMSMTVSPATTDKTQYDLAGASTVVPDSAYNLSNFITTKGIVKGIKTAIAASNKSNCKIVEIYSGRPFCFNGEILKAMTDGKKDVVYYFTYKRNVYSVTVPTTADASKVLEKSGFTGPLNVGQQLGTTRLLK